MLKRVLVFESNCHLSVRHGQLVRSCKEDKSETVIPAEDVGFVVIEHPAVTMSVRAVTVLLNHGAAVVFCDGARMPAAVTQALDGNATHAEVLRLQVEAGLPLKKRLWQAVVRSKIRNQSALLRQRGQSEGAMRLSALVPRVRSGDADNREAVAARKYWGSLFVGDDFTRDPEAGGINALLNYGYAILRAACARALVGSGLHCAFGLHHSNRYNAFALADDLMEPYRPFVDQAVTAHLDGGGEPSVDQSAKRVLLGMLSVDARMGDKTRPLMNSLTLSTASLVRCLKGEEDELALPMLP